MAQGWMRLFEIEKDIYGAERAEERLLLRIRAFVGKMKAMARSKGSYWRGYRKSYLLYGLGMTVGCLQQLRWGLTSSLRGDGKVRVAGGPGSKIVPEGDTAIPLRISLRG